MLAQESILLNIWFCRLPLQNLIYALVIFILPL